MVDRLKKNVFALVITRKLGHILRDAFICVTVEMKGRTPVKDIAKKRTDYINLLL